MKRPVRYKASQRNHWQAPPGCPADAIVLSFPVAHDYHGLRLDRFIQERIPRLSRTRAQEIIRACAYHHDGRRRRPSDRVQVGEVVLLVRSQFEEPDAPTDFDVVYEDEWIYAVDKPAGLAVHPTASYHRGTLTFLLRQKFPDNPPILVHRLDRETSGLLVCAKSRQAEVKLKLLFENRQIEKTYVAIVRDSIKQASGSVDAALRPSQHQHYHFLMETTEQPGALSAHTRFDTLARQADKTFVRLRPLTGRQHQLRVHMASIGHAILGDKIYGPGGVDAFFEAVRKGISPELLHILGHHRQALHAHRLCFEHPFTAKPLTITAPIAADMLALWNAPLAL